MATVETHDFIDDVSEYTLIGMLFFMLDTFKGKKVLNLEVSLRSDSRLFPKYIPRSFSLYTHYDKLSQFKKESGKKFQSQKEFDEGYDLAFSLVNKYIKNLGTSLREENSSEENSSEEENFSEEESPELRTDVSFLEECKLLRTPEDKPMERQFMLRVPAYLWDIAEEDNLQQEQLTANLLGLFLRDCTEKDHLKLINEPVYLRFLPFRDTPDSQTYVYGYLRCVEECTYPSHKTILTKSRKTHLPCEVIHGNRGYFYDFPMYEWKNRKIEHFRLIG